MTPRNPSHTTDGAGAIFDIKRFAIHDGPGIRTTVFLKGCPLSCPWCHNPEGISPEPQLVFTPAHCIGCRACLEACPRGVHRLVDGEHVIDRDRCEACGACVEGCFAGALRLAGRRATVTEVIEEVSRDRPFYERSGGGMTLSGGEPLLQHDFAAALLRAAKAAGLHTALDTSAFAPWPHMERLLDSTDLVLCDLKHMDGERHRALTGVSNERILGNLRRMDAAGQAMWIRVPLIGGRNDGDANYHAMGRFLSGLKHAERIEILRHHRLAGSKYASVGATYALEGLEPPTEAEAQSRRQVLLGYGLSQTVVR